MNHRAMVSEIVGEAYPRAVTTSEGRLRRNWLVRSEGTLPSEPALAKLASILEDDAFAGMSAAYSESTKAEQLAQARPFVEIVRLDDLHAVVRIEFAGHERAVGASSAISQWGVLQGLDAVIRIADVQGIPRAFWFLLRETPTG